MLTDAQIKKLKHSDPKKNAPDKESFGQGLQLYVYRNGIKTWHICYRHQGVQKDWDIGDYPDVTLAEALKMSDEAKALRKKGIDPKQHAIDQAELAAVANKPTLGFVINTYLTKESILHKGHKWNSDRFKKFIREFPEICSKPVDQIVPLDLIKWRDKRLEFVTPASVSREFNLLSSVFTYAVKEMQLIEANPMSNVKKPKAGAPRLKRVSNEEIEIICNACGYVQGTTPQTKKQMVAWCFLFAIESAMRASEITQMTWANVHGNVVHLPDTKNGTSRDVSLLKSAIALLELMRGIDELRVVTIDAESLSTMFRKVRDKTVLKDADLRFHDSRHEACTRLAQLIPIQDLAKVTGHKDLKILLNTYYNPTAQEIAVRMSQGLQRLEDAKGLNAAL